MSDPIETLVFSAHETGVLTGNQSILFVNAQPHTNLQKHPHLTCIQHFYPTSKTLLDRAYSTFPTFEHVRDKRFKTAFILLPQNITQARYYIARALTLLTEDGTLICAAANSAGGKRLKPLLNEFKIQNVSYISKNKSKSAHCRINTYDQKGAELAVNGGTLHLVEKTGYYAQAGIYGWDKIDTGSRLLGENVDIQSLQGSGADFGCGYGYLAKTALQANDKITDFFCIDADYNALNACKRNLSALKNTNIEYIWDDLTNPDYLPQNLDFIVMNPPFHRGKTADTAIGQHFIENAAKALKKNGVLWMVANTHLPYENILSRAFSSISSIIQENGFKVLRAVK